jgi:hypothetical protein
MLKPETPDRFLVDFAQTKRKGNWKRLFEPKAVVVVDAWAIGQAVVSALAVCPFKSATGRPQVWNEYRVFLSRADHDRLRPVEVTLQKDLAPLLYEELVRLEAVTVGALVVRLLVDDADEVEPGRGILHARHIPDTDATAVHAGEITVRLDKPKATMSNNGTLPVGALILRTPAGELVLRGGRTVLGRAHPDAGHDHQAIPGANGRINRRQLALKVEGGGVEVTREPDGNPVAVNGTPLAAGQSTVVALPAELLLSGELVVSVAAA